MPFNPLNAKLNPTCHLLALLGAHRILHVSRIRVNYYFPTSQKTSCLHYKEQQLLTSGTTAFASRYFDKNKRCLSKRKPSSNYIITLSFRRLLGFYDPSDQKPNTKKAYLTTTIINSGSLGDNEERCIILVFRRDINEICALLGFYAA